MCSKTLLAFKLPKRQDSSALHVFCKRCLFFPSSALPTCNFLPIPSVFSKDADCHGVCWGFNAAKDLSAINNSMFHWGTRQTERSQNIPGCSLGASHHARAKAGEEEGQRQYFLLPVFLRDSSLKSSPVFKFEFLLMHYPDIGAVVSCFPSGHRRLENRNGKQRI